MGFARAFRVWLGLAAVCIPLVAPRGAKCDDRRLFQRRVGKPHLFLLADTSADMALGLRDEWLPAGQDDPASRAYLLRQGVYEFLDDRGGEISVGWARLDLSGVEVRSKHRIYTPAEDPSWLDRPPFAGGAAGPPWNGPGTPGVAYPRRGHPLVFGGASAHDGEDPGGRPDDDTDGSCLFPEDLDTGHAGGPGASGGLEPWTDTPALSRLWTFAKLGDLGDRSTRQWFRFAGQVYRLTWRPAGTGLDPGDWPEVLEVDVRLERATGTCAEGRLERVAEERLTLEPFHRLDLSGRPLPGTTEALLGAGSPPWVYSGDDYGHDPGCATVEGGAWDGNRDDLGSPYSYDTRRDPLGRDGAEETFDRGDRLPLEWRQDLSETDMAGVVMRRLAPNLELGGETPDYRASPHVGDQVRERPDERLLPRGGPPLLLGGDRALGGALESFGSWYERWWAVASDPREGDPKASCRRTRLILLVGGGEACAGRAESAMAAVRSLGVAVAVIWLAAEPGPEALAEMDRLASVGGACADRDGDGGGGDCTWLAASAAGLADSLRRIAGLGEAPGGVTTGVAIAPTRADLRERLFLAGFTPVDAAVYPGWIHAFSRPLPTDPHGRPDLATACTPERPAACHLWDAQETVLHEQFDEIDPVGPGSGRRQVFYAELGRDLRVPGTRRFFAPTDDSTPVGIRHDLWRGLDIDFVPGDLLSERTAEAVANGVIRLTLAVKSAVDGEGVRHEYLLGDVFHSTPIVLGSPGSLAQLEREAAAGGSRGDEDCDYTCFVRRHRLRRQVLVAGANDGMLHGFDAGVFRPGDGPRGGSFDAGTGRELFAYLPRPVLPTVQRLASDRPARHRYSVDGGLVAADVFIDPVHEGFGSSRPPEAGDREWRTVLIGGLRRGGERAVDLREPPGGRPGPSAGASGLYALDLTQPDPIEPRDLDGDGRPESVPSVGEVHGPPGCLGGAGAGAPPGCGAIPWATPLWEFTDALPAPGGEALVSLDEDGNGLADLAFTWSRPNIGRILVCPSVRCGDDQLEERHVAVFGGGLDPEHPRERGNWLYMVDVETGQAIYKRRLLGAAPSEPAAVDLDFDGFLDRVYLGTALGLVYRVDLWSEDEDGYREYPVLETVRPSAQVEVTLPRLTGERLEPRILFEANDGSLASVLDGSTPARPFYFAPSVLFSAELDGPVLAMGTGEREDLSATGGPTGRFHVLVDDVRGSDLESAGFVPMRPEGLVGLLPGHSGGVDYLRAGDPDARGWYLELQPDERLVATPVGVGGAVTFSTWRPASESVRGEPADCRAVGSGRVYALDTSTAATLLFDDAGEERPFLPVPGLAGGAFVEPARVGSTLPEGFAARELAPGLEKALETLRARLPTDCRFADGVRMDLRIALDDGRVADVLPIPVCIRQWSHREP